MSADFRPKLTADDRAEVVRMLADGVPQKEIADAFGITASTVSYYAVRSGRATRSHAGKTREEAAVPDVVDDDDAWTGLGHFPAFYDDALCAQVDPEIFFPKKGGSSREAKAVCARCPVAAECLDYSLSDPRTSALAPFSFGIWGGTTERQRRHIRDAMNTANQEKTA